MLAHHARGFGGALVEEEVTASIECAHPCAWDLLGEDASILERGDHVVGAVHDQRRYRDRGQTPERVIRLPHRVELSGEHARPHRVKRTLPYLRLDEFAVRALKLR